MTTLTLVYFQIYEQGIGEILPKDHSIPIDLLLLFYGINNKFLVFLEY